MCLYGYGIQGAPGLAAGLVIIPQFHEDEIWLIVHANPASARPVGDVSRFVTSRCCTVYTIKRWGKKEEVGSL